MRKYLCYLIGHRWAMVFRRRLSKNPSFVWEQTECTRCGLVHEDYYVERQQP